MDAMTQPLPQLNLFDQYVQKLIIQLFVNVILCFMYNGVLCNLYCMHFRARKKNY